jgi:hypothetical protein
LPLNLFSPAKSMSNEPSLWVLYERGKTKTPVQVSTAGCRNIYALIDKVKDKLKPNLDEFDLDDISIYESGSLLDGDDPFPEHNSMDTPLLVKTPLPFVVVIEQLILSKRLIRSTNDVLLCSLEPLSVEKIRTESCTKETTVQKMYNLPPLQLVEWPEYVQKVEEFVNNISKKSFPCDPLILPEAISCSEKHDVQAAIQF